VHLKELFHVSDHSLASASVDVLSITWPDRPASGSFRAAEA